MVAPVWATCLLSVPFPVVWWSPEALRIIGYISLGKTIFHTVWENGLKCILIDVSGEELRMFCCFTQGLRVFSLLFCFHRFGLLTVTK